MKLIVILLFTMSSYSGLANGPLELSDEPLFLDQSVPPALAVTFDDSGSMSWSWMPDSRSFYWNRVSFASPDYNLMYYNPDIDYDPPVKADGTLMPDSNFYSALRDGYYTAGNFAGRVDLSKNYRPVRYYYPYYTDPNYGYTVSANGAGSYDLEYSKSGRTYDRNPAFYYKYIGSETATDTQKRDNRNLYKLVVISGAEQRQNFANWYTYYNTRSKLAKAAMSFAFENFGPDFKVDWQQINNNKFDPADSDMKLFGGQHRQDFYDWLYLVPSNGSTPLREATKNAGDVFKKDFNETNPNSPYYSTSFGKELSCQQNFHIAVSDGSWNGGEGVTGNRDKTSVTLPSVDGEADPIVYDPTKFMYADINSGSLADNAFFYWSRDLRPDLANNVPIFIDDYTDSSGNELTIDNTENWFENKELFWNPKNDPASWQHMVNFNVGLGIEGGLDRATDFDRLRSKEIPWPRTVEDTCFRYITEGGDLRIRSCIRMACYDETNGNGNIVDCAENVAPLGPIKSCENLENGRIINCLNRIVKYINESAGRVDDVWHSSINSRGDYFSAKDPNELSDALYNVVTNIIKRVGRSSAGSVSSNIITTDSLSYKTGYDTSNWSGFVTGQLSDINSDGEILWDAACKLTGGYCSTTKSNVTATNSSTSRKIITYDKDGTGPGTQYLFKSGELSDAMNQKIIDSEFYRDTVQFQAEDIFTADDVIDYVRGDRSKEEDQGGQFRNRTSVLADVIHSSANVIRGPSASYVDEIWFPGTPERIASENGSGYKEYRENNRNRDSVLLVGSNGGMLHAFDAGIENNSTGGDEKWAYVPSKALNGMADLADPGYDHRSFVDASPNVSDAFINGSWGTYALGGMRKGGKLFYALNLGANPANIPSVMWEFTDENDPDLGYSYGGGVITRVAIPDSNTTVKTKWVAIVPNGYNSTNNKAVMYALDLKDGTILHKWDTEVGDFNSPNGMATPVASDFVGYLIDQSGNIKPSYGSDQSSEFVYAGDLAGNVYRFDLSKIFSDAGGTSKPQVLMQGSANRPITTSPRLFSPDDGSENVIVVFGTGKYIEIGDRATAGRPKQYLFGLKDSKSTIASSYTLNDSRIISQSIAQSGDTRTLSNNPVTNQQSWKIQLPDQGERMVNAISRFNSLKVFGVVTVIPGGSDPCIAGGSSRLMFINASTGGTPKAGRFLRNGTADGILINDIVLGINILSTVGGNEQFVSIDVADTGSSVNDGEIEALAPNKWRRRSWRRLQIGD